MSEEPITLLLEGEALVAVQEIARLRGCTLDQAMQHTLGDFVSLLRAQELEGRQIVVIKKRPWFSFFGLFTLHRTVLTRIDVTYPAT